MIMPEFSPCPACGAIAEITDRFVLASTDGPVDHLADLERPTSGSEAVSPGVLARAEEPA
jgi:hypothetical protein